MSHYHGCEYMCKFMAWCTHLNHDLYKQNSNKISNMSSKRIVEWDPGPIESNDPWVMFHTQCVGMIVVDGGLHPIPLDKMATISQTFSSAFLWLKSFVFWFKFHWTLFQRVQLTIRQHWFRWWLGAERQQAIIWTNADPVHLRIYVALGEVS